MPKQNFVQLPKRAEPHPLSIEPSDFHILLAEDDPKQREAYTAQLQELKFHYFYVYDGKMLKQMLENKSERKRSNLVIVSDSDMPEMDGDEACRAILEKYPLDMGSKIIIPMSYEYAKKDDWTGVGTYEVFLKKDAHFTNPKHGNNFGNRVARTLDHIMTNKEWYILPNGNVRKYANE